MAKFKLIPFILLIAAQCISPQLRADSILRTQKALLVFDLDEAERLLKAIRKSSEDETETSVSTRLQEHVSSLRRTEKLRNWTSQDYYKEIQSGLQNWESSKSSESFESIVTWITRLLIFNPSDAFAMSLLSDLYEQTQNKFLSRVWAEQSILRGDIDTFRDTNGQALLRILINKVAPTAEAKRGLVGAKLPTDSAALYIQVYLQDHLREVTPEKLARLCKQGRSYLGPSHAIDSIKPMLDNFFDLEAKADRFSNKNLFAIGTEDPQPIVTVPNIPDSKIYQIPTPPPPPEIVQTFVKCFRIRNVSNNKIDFYIRWGSGKWEAKSLDAKSGKIFYNDLKNEGKPYVFYYHFGLDPVMAKHKTSRSYVLETTTITQESFDSNKYDGVPIYEFSIRNISEGASLPSYFDVFATEFTRRNN